jgi:hypothetical protein
LWILSGYLIHHPHFLFVLYPSSFSKYITMSKTKSGLQGNRITGKMYQSVCSCEWKSGTSTARSAVQAEGSQHKIAGNDPYAKPKHITQLIRVQG